MQSTARNKFTCNEEKDPPTVQSSSISWQVFRSHRSVLGTGLPCSGKCTGRQAKLKIWIFHVFLENVHLANLLKSFLCMFVLWNLCTPVTFPLSDVAAPFSIDPTKCCCTHTHTHTALEVQSNSTWFSISETVS